MKDDRTWTLTRYPNLYRHKSGTYYARLTGSGKKTWRSLKTETISIARARFAKLNEEEGKRKELAREHGLSDDRLTLAVAIALHAEKVQNDPSLKPSSRHYYRQVHLALLKSLGEDVNLELRDVTEAHCLAWASAYSKQVSPTRFNNTVATLRGVFADAIKVGVRFSNPTQPLKRLRPNEKNLSVKLPNRKQFVAWVEKIRTAGGRFSKPAADLVEFLAYSGLRIGEAKFVEWQHCDLVRGELLVVGDPIERTKNGEMRRVPIIPALEKLIERMKADNPGMKPDEPVLKVHEAQKAMNHASEKLKLPRITHHDLRHLFATTCIESGVDIPTVSRWLGHKDGGALAMRVYGHLRNEHSLESAKKVSFT